MLYDRIEEGYTFEDGLLIFGNSKVHRYFQSHIEEDVKFLPEGIEGSLPYEGHLSESIYQFFAGLRDSRGNAGSASIEELRAEPRFVKITAAGLQESHAHDIFITEEASNYPMNVKS